MNVGAKTSDFHPSTLLKLENTEKFEMFDAVIVQKLYK